MPPRPCLDCGRLTPTSPCPTCTQQRNAKRNARREWYGGDWARRSHAIRKAWVDEHGWICPGYRIPPHPSTDLTVDHVDPRNPTVLAVLCRSCNASKGQRTTTH